MRKRFSPRCTSSSAIPVSCSTRINSLISSIVMQIPPGATTEALQDHQVFLCRRQDLATGLGDHHGILDPHPAEAFYVYARLDGNGHAGLQSRRFLPADPRAFVNLEPQTVAGR